MAKTAFLLYSWRLLNSGMPTAKETGKLSIQQMQLHHAGAFRAEHDVLPMAHAETSYASAKAIPIQVFLMSSGFLL